MAKHVERRSEFLRLLIKSRELRGHNGELRALGRRAARAAEDMASEQARIRVDDQARRRVGEELRQAMRRVRHARGLGFGAEE